MSQSTNPPCVGHDYSQDFFKPSGRYNTFDEKIRYTIGDKVELQWYGGVDASLGDSNSKSRSASRAVCLKYYDGTNSIGTNATVESTLYLYTGSTWTGQDVCGNTVMNYTSNVAVPKPLVLDSGTQMRFQIIVQNASDTSKMVTSPGFYIKAAGPESLSSSSTRPTPSPSSLSTPSTNTPSFAPTSPPTPQPSLSTDAKAGIGVGTAIAAILIDLIAFFLFCRRRRIAQNATGESNSRREDGYNKPELDGTVVEKQLVEIAAGGNAYSDVPPVELEARERPRELDGVVG